MVANQVRRKLPLPPRSGIKVREVDGHPAYEARKRVVAFLTERLRPES